MSSELDNVARSIYNGHIPMIWRRLAPATLKTLGNWMVHFQQRYDQYNLWVMPPLSLFIFVVRHLVVKVDRNPPYLGFWAPLNVTLR